METWHQFSETQPKADQIVWVWRKRLRAPMLQRFSFDSQDGRDEFRYHAWDGYTKCMPGDLWCKPVPPLSLDHLLSEKRPRSQEMVWMQSRGMKELRLRRFNFSSRGYHSWADGPTAYPNDLWSSVALPPEVR